ncbi:hypothetical protein [Helicobacter sp. 11S02596-1]|uniref:hypothetical protein n=1 Tax=Helicobacter sp. 11S02596-1 TaxID=1476194 RepID=UPI000BA74C07|nr:hypothetical protein [Helicobacter sp. 11S02596-1]PAF45038.1 hypothetical protein BJI48_00240 [Helicobacter sp. 11S02596-1]
MTPSNQITNKLPTNPQNKSQALLVTLTNTLIFTIALILLLLGIRIGFVLYVGVYGGFMGDIGLGEVVKNLFIGMLYDRRYIALVALVFFVLSLLSVYGRIFRRWEYVYAQIVFVMCLFLGIAEMGFYQIYADGFNNALLGLIFDNTTAILKTGLNGQYNITPKLIIWVLASVFYCWGYHQIVSKTIPKSQALFERSFAFKALVFSGGGGQYPLSCVYAITPQHLLAQPIRSI